MQKQHLHHGLMHANQGQYREALVRYLLAVYSGRARRGTLAEVTETSYDELDRRYRTFLEREPGRQVEPEEGVAQ